MSKHRLTTDEFRIIEWHNNQLAAAARCEMERLQAIPRRSRPEWVQNQLLWWKHVNATLSWSTGVAKQRMGTKKHVNGSTV